MLNWIRSKHHKRYLSGAQLDPEGPPRESRFQRETVVQESVRKRPIGRIAGVLAAGPQAQQALRAAVPSDYQILDPDSEKECLIADWDCCELDGRPVTELREWWSIIRNGRLGNVHGAFVLAWTDATGCLSLARDAIGERSLYYVALPSGGFAFASSLLVLVDSSVVTPSLNLHAVALYLSCAYVPTLQTLVDGIHELPPGTVGEWRNGSLTLRRFWEIPTDSPTEIEADEAYEQANLRRWLEVAIRRRLPTEGDVAAFLSGGIDSSLIVALLRHLYDGEIVTLSVTFGAEYPNELAFSSAVARHCGVRHHIVELPPSSIMQNLDSTIALLSQPIGDPLTVSGMLVPVEAWFQGPLGAKARERILDGSALRHLFRRDYLETLLEGRMRGLRPRRGAKIWLLVTLEAWLRRVLGD